MARIVTFLNNDLIEDLKKLYKDSNKSVSRIVSELVDIGYKVKLHHIESQSDPLVTRMAELKEKHTEYLLRIVATANDIYRCVRSNKSKYAVETANEALDIIADRVQKFIRKLPSE